MTEGPPTKRARLNEKEIESFSKEELISKLKEADTYIGTLESKINSEDDDVLEKLKQQQIEATRRENVLVMRLTAKEQEMQEYLNQIQELKQAQNPSTSQLRSMLLDPAINLTFQRMKKEVDTSKEKLEQSQNELSAWKFTPDSQTGKRLMSRCRMLLSENEELGKVISAGRTAKLEGEIALEKKLVEELKQSQAESDEFLVELDEDVEGMQSTIYFLQQQLKETSDQLAALQKSNNHPGTVSADYNSSNMYQASAALYNPHEVMNEDSMDTADYSHVQYNTDRTSGYDEAAVQHNPTQTNGHHPNDDIPTPTDSDNDQMVTEQTVAYINETPLFSENTESSNDTWDPSNTIIKQTPAEPTDSGTLEDARYSTTLMTKNPTPVPVEYQENGLDDANTAHFTDEEI